MPFSDKINEELTNVQKAEVATWPRDKKAVESTDHFFGHGNDERTEPIRGTMDKSEIHKAIERHLSQEIEPIHYKEGHTFDKYNRRVRIGALLKKTKAPEQLQNDFANDSTRQGKKFTGLSVRTTRSAEGVASQTSRGHSWYNESCKNYDNGSNRHYLKPEVKHGTVVSYLQDHEGRELARATHQPYINDKGTRVYKVNGYYGIDHKDFKDHADKISSELSSPHNGGSYAYDLHPEVYNDDFSGFTGILHPHTPPEEIDKIFDSDKEYEKISALKSPNISSENIAKALNYETQPPDVRIEAARHKNITKDWLAHAMYDDDIAVRAAAAENENLVDFHFQKALHDDTFVAQNAVKNKAVGKEKLDQILDGPYKPDIKSCVFQNPNHTKDHITKALDNDSWQIKHHAVKSDKMDEDQLKKALADPNKFVKMAAAKNKNMTDELLNYAANHEVYEARMGAALNPRISGKLHEQLLNDKVPSVRRAALMSARTLPHQAKRLMGDVNEEVAKLAENIYKAATGNVRE